MPKSGRRLLSTDEMQILMTEIAAGLAREESQLAPLDRWQEEFWERHATQLIDAGVAGIVLEWRSENPDLNEYREGYASKLKP